MGDPRTIFIVVNVDYTPIAGPFVEQWEAQRWIDGALIHGLKIQKFRLEETFS